MPDDPAEPAAYKDADYPARPSSEPAERLTATEARGGTGMHIVKRILLVSVALAIAAMAWVWLASPEQPDTLVSNAPSAAR